jgi:hypothetical protein
MGSQQPPALGEADAAGKLRLTVHSTLTDVPFEVELDEPTVAHLQLQVGKHCQFPDTDLLKVVRRHALPPRMILLCGAAVMHQRANYFNFSCKPCNRANSTTVAALGLPSPQFHNNHALGKEWQLAEAGIKDGDELAVVWYKKRAPPKVLAEEQQTAESRDALPDKATVDAITAAEAEVCCMVACLLSCPHWRSICPS